MSRCSKRHVRDLVKKLCPSIFLIFETHVQFFNVEKFWKSLGMTLFLYRNLLAIRVGFGSSLIGRTFPLFFFDTIP